MDAPIHETHEQELIRLLRRSNQRMARAITAMAAMFAMTLAIEIALHAPSAWAGGQVAAPAAGSDGELRVRSISVVDENGTERVRIAAPLPEPIMLGKRFKRGGAVSGILIFDAEGNERGGYVTGDASRSAALTLDEINRAAVHIGTNDRGEMHVQMSNGMGGSTQLGVLPDGPFFTMSRDGKPVTSLPAPPSGGR